MKWLKNNETWIKELKIGDEVINIERNGNRIWKWKAKVIAIESNYIETTYARDWKNEELLALCKNLAPNHRTFSTQYVKNYFAPDGTINIEKIN